MLVTGRKGFIGKYIPLIGPSDIVIHLAWYGSATASERADKELQQTNLAFVKRLATDPAIANARWIVAGSQAELNTNTPYADVKIQVREWLQARFPTTWVRLYSVYGPGDHRSHFIPYLIDRCLSNQDVALTNQNIPWDYLYVSDAARAFIDLMVAPPGIYEVGSGEIIMTQDVARMVKEKTRSQSALRFGVLAERNVEVKHLKADITNTLPYWQPTITFEYGLEKTIQCKN